MRADTKKAVCAALRSKVYTQGHGELRDRNGCYCAMGVVADLIDPTKWALTLSGNYRHGGSLSSLDCDTLSRGGISFGEQNTIVDWNDSYTSFEDIADRIERQM